MNPDPSQQEIKSESLSQMRDRGESNDHQIEGKRGEGTHETRKEVIVGYKRTEGRAAFEHPSGRTNCSRGKKDRVSGGRNSFRLVVASPAGHAGGDGVYPFLSLICCCLPSSRRSV